MSLFGSIDAKISGYAKERIRSDLKAKKYHHLGIFLKNRIGSSGCDLSQVKAIARKTHSKSLLHAIEATRQFKKTRSGLGLSTGAFLQTSLFIETDLRRYTAHKHYYLPKVKTGIARTIEYDPCRKQAFIVLNGTQSAFLGKGCKKTAYKAIAYSHTKPEVVARAEQCGDMKRELKITKRLRGARGVIDIKGFGKHHKNGKLRTTTYSKLYKSSDLATALRKKVQFSLLEKAKIAVGALRGLESMHRMGIVHRDICSKNFFLTIPKGKKGKRNVQAVLADFGWAKYRRCCAGRKAQANARTTAPEGFSAHKLKNNDYLPLDVYATGLAFYQLFYGKKASWTNGSCTDSSSSKHNRKKVTSKINSKTLSRRLRLAQLKSFGKVCPEKDFEYLILRMIHPNPKKRSTATVLRRKMEHILKRIEYAKK
ncbi:MAG TPA: serine/threonine-protein kinase [Chlamydiales bacterium]|nr:serine/threonine-protein kinase [Chlamydiales bacterium]